MELKVLLFEMLQAHPNANLLSNDLHAALQNVVNEFIRNN